MGSAENAVASSSRLTLDGLRPTPKVSLVDTEELDEGLVHMLGERLEHSLGNFRSITSFDLKPELGVILKLIIFKLSYLSPQTLSSPGAKLQGLKLVNSIGQTPPRKRLLLYLLLHPPIFPSYLLHRIRGYALSHSWPDQPIKSWRRRAWRSLLLLENAARLWELGGWGMLLWNGKYPSLVMRYLDLRLVPVSEDLTKLVSYEFMNRQLVWGAFTEFLMFSLPLLPPMPAVLTPSTILQPIQSFFTQPTAIDYHTISSAAPGTSAVAGKTPPSRHSGRLADLPLNICPICYLRTTSSPVPLSSTSSGANISLPPLSGWDKDSNQGQDEMRIFVPARTDCWGECRWCYYCIAGEVGRWRKERAERSTDEKSVVSPKQSEKGQIREQEKEDKWECLRCGGGVTSFQRVGVEAHLLTAADAPRQVGDTDGNPTTITERGE